MLGGSPATSGLLAVLAQVVAMALALVVQDAEKSSAAPPDAKARGERLLKLHTEDAASYVLHRDPAKTEELKLRREPIYRWTNPTRVGGQEGDVFVWTYRGRPEVVASIFSHPHNGGRERVLCHELHSLSRGVIVVERAAAKQWAPQAPGVDLEPIDAAPRPAATAPQRLVQIRALARDFSGRSLSDRGQVWPLRLLPRPLYRYESTDPAVIDGALFALVSSAGTDPEIILVIEARETPDGPRWISGAARFSDMDLWLKHRDKEVWSSIRSAENTFEHDAKHRFRFYQDRIIPEVINDVPESQAR